MGRASVQIVIFLVLLTASANAIAISGVGDALGVQPDTGADAQVEQAQSAASDFQASQGSSETLFSLFVSGTSTFLKVFEIILAAPLMFVNLGVPGWLTTMLFAPMVIVVFADAYHLLTGRDP